MKWSEISVHTTQEAVEAVSNILHETGASGVVIEDPEMLAREWDVSLGEIYELAAEDYPTEGVIVKAYLPVDGDLTKIIEDIQLSIDNLVQFDIPIGKGEITHSEVDDEDWETAWKKYYKPIQISERITIRPTWEQYTPKEQDELVIELDPGMAFGTGTHPTTALCIRSLENHVTPGAGVIDVGSGSGILSIAAAKLGASSVLAMDLDEIAVKSTKMNVELNQLSDKISAKQNNLLEGITEPVDLIISNILAEIIVRFVEDAYRLLVVGGAFICSGIIAEKEEEVKSALKEVGFTIVDCARLDGWVSIVSKK
ncbi:ribosomal protein L11 methyltransferase [Ammoniphilus oxalaticus]|uniref:Ribosomal protein L11 methyltransferase n=1 Tax=Ammoniphilus oxalaticus TaxID=66863 RepID=A0A419SJ74_9BACL|nr:50S ribosomal protein L11 methyltransferase [Ammoniphilus oxalaticus]RKD23989.1 ribosomal protein L11 methyltransferase [Ammoniphilus oxalaticus]